MDRFASICFAAVSLGLCEVTALDLFEAPTVRFGTTLEKFPSDAERPTLEPDRVISNGALTVCLRQETEAVQASFIFAPDRLVAVARIKDGRGSDWLREGLKRFGSPRFVGMGMSPTNGVLGWELPDRWVVLQISFLETAEEGRGVVVIHADPAREDWRDFAVGNLDWAENPNLEVLRQWIEAVELGEAGDLAGPVYNPPPPPLPLDQRPSNDYERQFWERTERIRNFAIFAASTTAGLAVLLFVALRARSSRK